MRRLIYAIVFSAIVFLFSLGIGTAQAIDVPSGMMHHNQGISVSGTGEVRAMPDIAYVTLGVRTRADTANLATTRNATAMNRVIQAIRRAGIAEADIETVQYTVQPVFEYPQNAPPRITGYEATNLVKVTVRDLKQVGPIIDAAIAAEANVVQDVSFSLKDEAAARSSALTMAVQDGRAKASVMASALGVRLGPLISATEGSPPVVIPFLARAEFATATETPISPQQIVVRATVNLVYSIVR